MNAQIFKVITSSRYLRLHHPVDDAIRTKRCLTVLRPEYCGSFAALLYLIFKRVNKQWCENEEIIPDKGLIMKEIKMNLLSEEFVLMKQIGDTYIKRLPTLLLYIYLKIC